MPGQAQHAVGRFVFVLVRAAFFNVCSASAAVPVSASAASTPSRLSASCCACGARAALSGPLRAPCPGNKRLAWKQLYYKLWAGHCGVLRHLLVRHARAASRPVAAGQVMACRVPPGRMVRMQAGPLGLSSPVTVRRMWHGSSCAPVLVKPVSPHTWAGLQDLVQDGGDFSSECWICLGCVLLQAPEAVRGKIIFSS